MMNKKVSVIVATKNEEKNLKNLLESVKRQSYKNIEILVIDNNSLDNTKKIAKRYTDRVYDYGPERSSQRNYGVKKSMGMYVLILDADMRLNKNVISICVDKIQKCSLGDKKVGAIIISEKSYGKSYWAKCKALERNCYIADDGIEAARFFLRSVFLNVGGYNEKMISGEDWDLSNRIRKAGWDISRVNEFILHNEGNLSLIKDLKKKIYYAKHSNSYIDSNVKNPLDIVKFVVRPAYIRNWKILISDPLHLVGFMFMKSMEFFLGGIIIVINKLNSLIATGV